MFIGTPLLAVGVLIPIAQYFPSADFSAFLLSFFTFGHHLPGFLRVYGDRDLFARHRVRFLLAPPLVFLAALWFSWRDLHGLLFVVFTWDIWHVLMQQYGFLRIYDAKAGRADRLGAWADRAVALGWYLTFIAWSPHYSHDLFLRGYSAGLPPLSADSAGKIRTVMMVLSCVISAGYVALHFRFGKAGFRPGAKRLAALTCFLVATWYLYVVYPDFVVGFAVWSAFHCVQYYGIVWAFNRNRASKDSAVGRLLRFLFRPKPALVALYLGLILAYGGINWMTRFLPKGIGLQLLMAFIVTSGTLHYYYDGFIWRMREQHTRRGLSIDGTGSPPARVLARLRHPAVAQAAIAGLAVCALAWLEHGHPYDEVLVRQAVAGSVPRLGLSQHNYASALRQAGQYDQAAAVYESALRLNPDDALGWHEYGLTLAALGRDNEAITAFDRAVAVDPDLAAAHYNLASLLAERGETARALEHYRKALPTDGERSLRAIERDPAAADMMTNIALGLLQAGDREEASTLLTRVVSHYPRHASAQLNLGSLLAMRGDVAEARQHYRAAIECGDARIRDAAAGALAKLP